jgi:MFS family permease
MSFIRSPPWSVTGPPGALVACVGAYFAVRLAQLFVSPVVPAVIAAFDASRGAMGVVLSSMWVAYAAAQIPSGVLGDRYGGRAVVLAALGAVAVGSVLLAVAPTLLAFGVAAAALGAGAGLYYNAATALLTATYEAVGGAIGVHRIGGQAAGVVAPVAAAALASRFGWRVAVAAGALAAGLVLVAFVRSVSPDPPTRPNASLSTLAGPGTLRTLAARGDVVFTTLVAAVGEFAVLATMSFLPTFLVQHHGLSVGRAGLLFAGYFAVVGGLQPVVGVFSDRVGRDATVAGLFVVGVVGYATLAATAAGPLVVVGVGLVGVGMSWGPPLQSRAMDCLDDGERGAGFGLVRTGYILVGAVGTTVVGSAADAAGWGAAFGLLAALLAVAACGLAANRRLALGL